MTRIAHLEPYLSAAELKHRYRSATNPIERASLEFQSIELAQWLYCQHLSFVLRQKCNTTFREKRQPFQPLNSIAVLAGIHLFYPQINLTQNKGFSRFNLVASWRNKYKGKQEDEPWELLALLPDLKTANKIYGQRYGIEAMFKGCKTGGYNERGLSIIT